MKALGAFQSKLLKWKPCRKLLLIFKIRLKKPVFIIRRPFRKTFKPKPRINNMSSSVVFGSPKKSRDNDDMSNNINKKSGTEGLETESKEVEEACRRFEKYLVEMIVEEGKTIDLMDVEELLRCWKNLKSPVFIDLVSRFYGELCKDLF